MEEACLGQIPSHGRMDRDALCRRGIFPPQLKSSWRRFNVSILIFLGAWEINNCAWEDLTLTYPCLITESQKGALGGNSNRICAREGCVCFTNSWEGIGLKPSWKFLYPRGPKVDLWKPPAERGLFHVRGSPALTVHPLWMCSFSPQSRAVLSPRGPWLHIQWHLSPSSTPIWSALSHTTY